MAMMTVRQSNKESFFIHNKIPANKYREYILNKHSIQINELECKSSQCCELHGLIGWNTNAAIEHHVPMNWCNTCQKSTFTKDVQQLIANKDLIDIELPAC